MSDIPSLAPNPATATALHKARIYTDLPVWNEPARKQFFDVPLVPDTTSRDPVGNIVVIETGWQAFMASLLGCRGVLLTNFWLPERHIDLILLDPDEQAPNPSQWDPQKVVALKPRP